MKELLSQLIRKPLGTWKDEEEIRWVLRRRLTKKEYKILSARAERNPTKEELLLKLRLDEKRYEELWEKIGKKLNLDSIKKELFRFESEGD
ncbi:hypothetical protein [Nitratifractor sp.]